MDRWSAKNNWVARAAAWDDHLDATAQQHQVDLRKILVEELVGGDGKHLRTVASKLRTVASRGDVPAMKEVLARTVGPVPKVHYVVDLEELRKHIQAMLVMAREELGDTEAVRRLGERWFAYFDGLAAGE